MRVFLRGLCGLFASLLSQALRHYGAEYMRSGRLGKLLGHDGPLTWKSLHGSRQTVLYTIFGKAWVPQLQVRLHYADGSTSTRSVTRLLLGVSRFQRISDEMKYWMSLLSSLCSYRTARKVLAGLGFRSYALGSFRRSVLWVSQRLELGISSVKACLLLADGTGIATLNTGKRGSELKVIAEWVAGKLRLVNIGIGKYGEKREWQALFLPIKQCFEQAGVEVRKELAAVIDGCKAILSGIKNLDRFIRIQRDIWHITHQLKYYLWKDKVVELHKATLFKTVFSAAFPENGKTIEQRLEKLATAILLCSQFKYTACMSYLMNLAGHLAAHQEEATWEMPTAYSTKIERMMRTVNQRMDIGVWSEPGALAVAKIRLAHFYNGQGLSSGG